MSDEGSFPTIATAGELLATKQISSVQLTVRCLDRIERFDRRLNSFVTVTADRALESARKADSEIASGRRRGPLHGIPYGVKDVYDVAGLVTTGGSKAFLSNKAERNAAVIDRLEQSGAILLGKLATHELTHGGVSTDLPWPPARNPWNTDHDTGGSSTGAGAAVAAGLCLFALGTDTGGSIRLPAALCGVAGLKPNYGRISRFGVMLNAYTLDHCGVMAWTAAECGVVLQAIAGHDPRDPATSERSVADLTMCSDPKISGVRIGIVTDGWLGDAQVDPSVHGAMLETQDILRHLGATISEVNLPLLAEYNACKLTIQRPEFFSLYGERMQQRPEEFSAKLRSRVTDYDRIPAFEYVKAQARRRQLMSDMHKAMENLDVLITPGCLAPAPRTADLVAQANLNAPDITMPFNLTGFPAISICIGFDPMGLPVAMQIVGKPFAEATVLRLGGAYERATPWRGRRPLL